MSKLVPYLFVGACMFLGAISESPYDVIVAFALGAFFTLTVAAPYLANPNQPKADGGGK